MIKRKKKAKQKYIYIFVFITKKLFFPNITSCILHNAMRSSIPIKDRGHMVKVIENERGNLHIRGGIMIGGRKMWIMLY